MFDPSYQEILHLLQIWGYPVMLFLMIIEGPITTILAAFLASMGLFDWLIVYLLSVLADIIGDSILYFIGFFGGKAVLGKFSKTLKIKDSTINYLEQKFQKDGSKIVFSVKVSTGLSIITFVLAGSMKMNFGRFVLFSFLGGLLWSGLLVTLGYFFGYAAEQIEQYIKFAGWFILSFAIIFVVYINLLRSRLAKKNIRKMINKKHQE